MAANECGSGWSWLADCLSTCLASAGRLGLTQSGGQLAIWLMRQHLAWFSCCFILVRRFVCCWIRNWTTNVIRQLGALLDARVSSRQVNTRARAHWQHVDSDKVVALPANWIDKHFKEQVGVLKTQPQLERQCYTTSHWASLPLIGFLIGFELEAQ